MAVMDIFPSPDLTRADRQRLLQALKEAEAFIESDQYAPDEIINSEAATDLVNSFLRQIFQEEERVRQSSGKVAAREPYPDVSEELIFSVKCELNKPVEVSINAGFYEGSSGEKVLILDAYRHARRADEAFGGNWRVMTKSQGEELFEKLFGDEVVSAMFNRRLVSSHEERLHIRVRTSRDFLRIPFEYMISEPHRDYLILKYALARTIIGQDVIARSKPLSPKLLNELHREGKPLSILLIASNTTPDIPQADEEVKSLAEMLPKLFAEKHIATQVKVLSTDQASFERVKEEMANGEYHILHYAGHGFYDDIEPEKSFLPFWEEPERKGSLKEMTASTLQWVLETRKTLSFVYLSCCVGSAQGESSQLEGNDFLGITDALVQAHVPSVLGFRWPVVDKGAQNLALAFYRYLAQEGQVDTALLLARKELAQERENYTWLSPILILQA